MEFGRKTGISLCASIDTEKPFIYNRAIQKPIMIKTDQKERPLSRIARDYFDYLGRHLSQQCASDEFYFLPRSEAAAEHLDHLDDLRPERIQDHIQKVRDFRDRISPQVQNDLEEEIDRLLLIQSMESFLREYDGTAGWRNDPTLYAKIPLFATDRVLSQADGSRDQMRRNLRDLFDQIPSFFAVAMRNLISPCELAVQVGFHMARDACEFYRHDVKTFIEERMGGDKEVLAKNRRVLEAWDRFGRDLLRLSARRSFAIGEDGLRGILAVNLSYRRSPGEILEIARQAYHEIKQKITRFARKIDSRKTWMDIIYEQRPAVSSPEEVLKLYQREVVNLRRFFHSRDVMTFPPGEKVIVLKTPPYLQSLRATASYRAPLTGGTGDHGLFYITPGKEDLEIIFSHCPYLSAHETYPGHHVLDHIRIHHFNPIRRQVESPLFYEGWATYAEQLLDELGYIQDPRQQIVQLKRQLWRNLRAILDIELHVGKIGLTIAAKRIRTLGFSSARAERQVRRFALTPGYQLCYFMGAHEIMRLRERFSPQLGTKRFHDMLLGGGQIPFDLVEKRLQAFLAQKLPEGPEERG